mmetsp:Transcript_12661/g.27405  ORF Transcript_12661/g.27405 Transcript_12661/m.27405 type:complete len:314 (+) Transcript_12661:651-1592(+)
MTSSKHAYTSGSNSRNNMKWLHNSACTIVERACMRVERAEHFIIAWLDACEAAEKLEYARLESIMAPHWPHALQCIVLDVQPSTPVINSHAICNLSTINILQHIVTWHHLLSLASDTANESCPDKVILICRPPRNNPQCSTGPRAPIQLQHQHSCIGTQSHAPGCIISLPHRASTSDFPHMIGVHCMYGPALGMHVRMQLVACSASHMNLAAVSAFAFLTAALALALPDAPLSPAPLSLVPAPPPARMSSRAWILPLSRYSVITASDPLPTPCSLPTSLMLALLIFSPKPDSAVTTFLKVMAFHLWLSSPVPK